MSPTTIDEHGRLSATCLQRIGKKATKPFLRMIKVPRKGGRVYWLVLAAIVDVKCRATAYLLTLETPTGDRFFATTSGFDPMSPGVTRLVLIATHDGPAQLGSRSRVHVHYVMAWDTEKECAHLSLAACIRRLMAGSTRRRTPADRTGRSRAEARRSTDSWRRIRAGGLTVAAGLEAFAESSVF